MSKVRLTIYTLLLVLVLSSVFTTSVLGAESKSVYVIPVEQGIERGLQSFLQRGFDEAANRFADSIILEIDTLGGSIEAAINIGRLIKESDVPVIAFIKNSAMSAGAYISLNADQIIMSPGSQMGAAAPIDLAGNMADQKTLSFWIGAMEEAAKLRDRDPLIARGMVDPDVEIPGLTIKGELITLGASTALEHGYADELITTRAEVIQYLFPDSRVDVIHMEITLAEKIARFATNPFVMPILLLIGIVGIAAEVIIPGFGFPGIIGISSFALYFFGHYFAGFAHWEHIVLFVIGVILLVIELFIPGFGIFGAVGIGSLIAGIVLSAYELSGGFIALGIAFVISTIVVIILIKIFGFRGVWKRFVLEEEMSTEGGYEATTLRKDLVGQVGISITPLRPAGNIKIGNERIDVVTEGGFVPKDVEVEVIAVEGGRVVVRKKE